MNTDPQENLGIDPALKGRMLPGIAGITIFLLVLSILNVFGAVRYATGRNKYGVLILCTMLVIGLFGQLRMRRWGWALVLAACLLISVAYAYAFSQVHDVRFLVWALFMLLFFLYLVRPEVRDRML